MLVKSYTAHALLRPLPVLPYHNIRSPLSTEEVKEKKLTINVHQTILVQELEEKPILNLSSQFNQTLKWISFNSGLLFCFWVAVLTLKEKNHCLAKQACACDCIEMVKFLHKTLTREQIWWSWNHLRWPHFIELSCLFETSFQTYIVHRPFCQCNRWYQG